MDHRNIINNNTASTATTTIPEWLENICTRIRNHDPDCTSFIVPKLHGHPNRPTPLNATMIEYLIHTFQEVAAVAATAAATTTTSTIQQQEQQPNSDGQHDKNNNHKNRSIHNNHNNSSINSTSHLQVLYLSGCIYKNPYVIQPLMENLLPSQQNKRCGLIPALMTLSLSSNNLDDSHAVLIGKALKYNTTLEELYLSSNHISDEGAIALANGFHRKIALKVLALSWNDINEMGCYALADTFRSNSTLERLDLLGNNITIDGAKALYNAIQYTNYSLEELWLSGNWGITSEQKHSIDKSCEHNRYVKKIYKILKYENPEIPLAVWPMALQHINAKPDLLYGILQLKAPNLCREPCNPSRRTYSEVTDDACESSNSTTTTTTSASSAVSATIPTTKNDYVGDIDVTSKENYTERNNIINLCSTTV